MISPSRNSRACAVAASVIAAEIANANSFSACFISPTLIVARSPVHYPFGCGCIPSFPMGWIRALAYRLNSVLQGPQSECRGSLPSGPDTVPKARLQQAPRIPTRVVEGIMAVKKMLAVECCIEFDHWPGSLDSKAWRLAAT